MIAYANPQNHLKSRDSIAKDNKYDQQKENIDKYEKVRLQLPGYDLSACLSNFKISDTETKKFIWINMFGYMKACEVGKIKYLDTKCCLQGKLLKHTSHSNLRFKEIPGEFWTFSWT